MKDVYGNKNDRLFSIIPMPVRRIFVCGRSIPRSKNLLSTVSKRYCVRPLEEINHDRPVLMTMYGVVTSGFNRNQPHPQIGDPP